MEPGSGRTRGFRAPSPPAGPLAVTPPAEPPASDSLDLGAPPGRFARVVRASRVASWRWLAATAAVLVVAIAVIANLSFQLGASTAASSAAETPSPVPTPAESATPLATTDLYTQVVPSVVLITTSKGSLGSGTVVTDTGTILTANHVVADGSAVTVTFTDGTRSSAEVASRSTATDTATLRPKKLPEVVVPATVGGGAQVGADVVAIGNPLGLRASTSTGIVSGLGRTNKTAAGTITGLIQFDAAVNPGSSGGPLLDTQGSIIGVVLSIADPGKDDAFAGIGFAVPIGAALGGGGDGPGPGGGPQL